MSSSFSKEPFTTKGVLKVLLLDKEAQRPSPKMTEKLIRAICSTWFHSPEEMVKVIIGDTNSKACLPIAFQLRVFDVIFFAKEI